MDGSIDIDIQGGVQNAVFDNIGNGGSYSIPSSADLEITGDLSIEMWLYPTTFGIRQNPINKTYAGEFTWTLETSGQINFYYGNLGSDGGSSNVNYDAFPSNTPLTLNQWNHVVMVRDFTNNELRAYVNGALTRIETNVNINPVVAGSEPVLIGDGYTNPF